MLSFLVLYFFKNAVLSRGRVLRECGLWCLVLSSGLGSFILDLNSSTYLCFFILCYMSISFACMYVHHMHSWCPQKPGEGIVSPRTRVTSGCELPCGWWKLNLRALNHWATLPAPISTLLCVPWVGEVELSHFPTLRWDANLMGLFYPSDFGSSFSPPCCWELQKSFRFRSSLCAGDFACRVRQGGVRSQGSRLERSRGWWPSCWKDSTEEQPPKAAVHVPLLCLSSPGWKTGEGAGWGLWLCLGLWSLWSICLCYHGLAYNLQAFCEDGNWTWMSRGLWRKKTETAIWFPVWSKRNASCTLTGNEWVAERSRLVIWGLQTVCRQWAPELWNSMLSLSLIS